MRAVTLTTGTDIFAGTSGNDTVTGDAGTPGAGDVFVDSSTTDADVANLTISGTVGAVALKNVETVNLKFDFSSNVDIGSVSNATSINLSSGTAGNSAATVKGVKTASGNNIVANSDIKTLALEGSTATTDSAVLTAKASTLALTTSTNAIETLKIKTDGAASKVTYTTTVDPTTIDTAGDKDLTIIEGAASDLAGITINDGMTTGAKLTVKSIATAAVDYSKVAATATLEIGGALNGAATLNATQAAIKVSADMNTGAVLTAKSGASNTMNLAISADQTNDVETSGYTTINLTHAKTDTTSTLALAAGIKASGATVNISGAGNITLGAAGAESTLAAVDATSATGNISAFLASAKLAKFTGGSGDDTATITGATAFNMTVSGGTGTDTLDINSAGALDLSSSSVSLDMDVWDVKGVGNTLTIAGSQVTGKTISWIGDGSDVIKVTSVASGDNIDLSAVSVNTVTVSVVGGNGTDTLKGTRGADDIAGGAGDDVIVGNNGADTITGGAGSDSIDVTETVAAADKIILDQTAGKDTITGFTLASDILAVTITGVTTAENVVSAAGASATTLDSDTTIFTINAKTTSALTTGSKTITDFADLTQVAAYLNEAGTLTTSGVAAAVLNDGTSSYVYYLSNDGATAAIAATDVTLVGVVSNAILTATEVAQA